jgi:NAD(P)-dependent dehydrogenase (short-subunit alcohol dehydrogenase family)
MDRLNGKVAVITGGAGAIGIATAELFLREGAKVMLVDCNERGLCEAAERLGGACAIAAADVSSPEGAASYVSATINKFGAIDVLFCNAGTEGRVAPIHELAVEDFDRVLAVNVRGVFLGIRAAVPELAKRGGGSVVIASSVAGLLGVGRFSAYVTSKHAVIGLARAAALDLAPLHIRVNTVNPGPIDNRMMRSIEEQLAPGHADEVKRGFEAAVPLARYGTNEEIAQLALFLASDDSSYCTGAVFVADGGFSTQ